MFATLPALDLLEQADDWFCDRTFSTAPNVFYQVYTIHGTVEGYHIPLVYALLPDKKEETYQKLFNLLPQGCKRITIDFEVAVRNALTKLSENNQIQFCFFHLGQNLWRHVQSTGKASDYTNNLQFREHVRMLLCTAFLPVDDVALGFEKLQESAPED